MFAKKIIDSARFLKMPVSSQSLYFHLGMRADDDGVVEAFSVMRLVGATEDDLKILVAKGFVVVLNDDLVTYLTDWTEHNQIRADRKIDSQYKDLLLQVIPDAKVKDSRPRADAKPKQITEEASTGRPDDVQRPSNGPHRLGKDRLGKVRLVEDRLERYIPPAREEIGEVKAMYRSICKSLPELSELENYNRDRDVLRLLAAYPNLDMFRTVFEKAEASAFLRGGGSRGFRASFGWLMKQDNFVKVYEGQYDDSGGEGNIFLDMLGGDGT